MTLLFMLGATCVCNPARAESAAAASGKAIEQSYLAARSMGREATSEKMMAATKPFHDRAKALHRQEMAESYRRFALRSQSFFGNILSKITGKPSPGNTPMADSGRLPSASQAAGATPAQAPQTGLSPSQSISNRVDSTGPNTGAAGAHGVKYSSDEVPKNSGPTVGADGIITDR